MDILITDYYCASNRGDAAIFEGELAALGEEFPDAEITLMTEYPDAAQVIHGIDAVEQKLPPFKSTQLKKNLATSYLLAETPLYTAGIRTSPGEMIRNALDLQPYYDADVVISTGGQYITDIYMPSKVAILAELLLCKRLGTPVVLYAQSFGPFEGTRWQPLIRRVLNEVDLITTRDKISINHLRQLGVNETPIHALSDAAFAMPVDGEKPTHPLLDEPADETLPSDLDHAGPTVSISIREWSHFDDGSQESYLSAIAETADWLINEHNAVVFFASTCTSFDSYHKDDRMAALDAIEQMEYEDRAELLTGEYTPYDLVDIYNQMSIHIGTRMHSNILAMLAGTPIVPIGYQFKTRGTMELFDMEDRVLDIDKLTSKKLRKCVSETLTNREEIATEIQEKLPQIADRSRRNATLIHETIS